MINFERYEKRIRECFECSRFLNDALNEMGDLAGQRFESMDSFIEWGYKEDSPVPVLCRYEHDLLCRLETHWAYIARDEDGSLYVFYTKPKKYTARNFMDDEKLGKGVWSDGSVGTSPCLSALFGRELLSFISWSDEEPWKITDLLKLEVKAS